MGSNYPPETNTLLSAVDSMTRPFGSLKSNAGAALLLALWALFLLSAMVIAWELNINSRRGKLRRANHRGMWSPKLELLHPRGRPEQAGNSPSISQPQRHRPKRPRRHDRFPARLGVANERASAFERMPRGRRLPSRARAADFRGRAQENLWMGRIHFEARLGQ